eukprot:2903986-Amphidinium_carterae.1
MFSIVAAATNLPWKVALLPCVCAFGISVDAGQQQQCPRSVSSADWSKTTIAGTSARLNTHHISNTLPSACNTVRPLQWGLTAKPTL